MLFKLLRPRTGALQLPLFRGLGHSRYCDSTRKNRTGGLFVG